jgi:hypothetical protein
METIKLANLAWALVLVFVANRDLMYVWGQ